MQEVIHKITLPNNGTNLIEMPDEAVILTALNQDNTIAVYYLCDPTKKTQVRKFEVCGTGAQASTGDYIGTLIIVSFVWHIFDLGYV